LNPSKTEALVEGTWQQVTSFNDAVTQSWTIQYASITVSYSKSIRVLGVIIHQHLMFDNHIKNAAQSFNYHTRIHTPIRWLIDKDTANTLGA
jgi:hypothetical protein